MVSGVTTSGCLQLSAEDFMFPSYLPVGPKIQRVASWDGETTIQVKAYPSFGMQGSVKIRAAQRV